MINKQAMPYRAKVSNSNSATSRLHVQTESSVKLKFAQVHLKKIGNYISVTK